ncbi:MAG TPA: hypothetical protein VF250_00180 [Conexibacter sp.]
MSQAVGSARLDYLYQQYTRLSTNTDAFIRGSFDDFRMLAAIGALLAWPPLADSKLFEGDSSDFVLFAGLLAILFVVAALLTRDLLKQSIIRFWIHELRHIEQEIRREFGDVEAHVFRHGDHWVSWEARWYRPLLAHSALVFGLILLGFPVVVLALKGQPWQVPAYVGTFSVIALVVADAESRLRRSAQAEASPTAGA